MIILHWAWKCPSNSSHRRLEGKAAERDRYARLTGELPKGDKRVPSVLSKSSLWAEED